jgi:hypothetical protein
VIRTVHKWKLANEDFGWRQLKQATI